MMISDDIILAQCGTVVTVWLEGGKQPNETKSEGYSPRRKKDQDGGTTDLMHFLEDHTPKPALTSRKFYGSWAAGKYKLFLLPP
jgi:hypothetical protein